jgi:hypothetical protein
MLADDICSLRSQVLQALKRPNHQFVAQSGLYQQVFEGNAH